MFPADHPYSSVKGKIYAGYKQGYISFGPRVLASRFVAEPDSKYVVLEATKDPARLVNPLLCGIVILARSLLLEETYALSAWYAVCDIFAVYEGALSVTAIFVESVSTKVLSQPVKTNPCSNYTVANLRPDIQEMSTLLAYSKVSPSHTSVGTHSYRPGHRIWLCQYPRKSRPIAWVA